MAYTKLFSSIVTSTIWVETDRTRIVWITMLALADKNGEVQASIPGLARIAGVPIADCEEAIGKFLAPDPYSRTPDDEGRRIEKIDGGWALINHAKYREMASREESKDAHAKRQKRYRDREKRNVTVSDASVTPSDESVTDTVHIADADTYADSDIQTIPPLSPDGGMGKIEKPKKTEEMPRIPDLIDTPNMRQAWETWLAYRKSIRKSVNPFGAKQSMKDFLLWGERESIQSIENSIRNGWQGLVAPKAGPSYQLKSEPVRVQT